MDPLDSDQFGFAPHRRDVDSLSDGRRRWCVLATVPGLRHSAVVRAVSLGRAAPTPSSLGLLTVILPPMLGWQVVVLTVYCW